jgi:uncharacterized membrane protein
VAGQGRDTAWTPALVEIEDALVPAFIIEQLPGDRFTVFVPSVPTPLAGAVYILDRARVHAVDVSFTDAIKVVSHWGQGSGELIRAARQAARDDEAPTPAPLAGTEPPGRRTPGEALGPRR